MSKNVPKGLAGHEANGHSAKRGIIAGRGDACLSLGKEMGACLMFSTPVGHLFTYAVHPMQVSANGTQEWCAVAVACHGPVACQRSQRPIV